MGSRVIRFLSLFFTALVLGGALAHLFELPNKISLSREDYLTVQQIYRGWAMLGIVIAGSLITTLLAAIKVRKEPQAFLLTLIALVCLVGAQVVFWSFTYPANQATNNWTFLPDNWEALRRQWEYSHAAGAGLNLLAMASLILSFLTKRELAEPSRISFETHSEFPIFLR